MQKCPSPRVEGTRKRPEAAAGDRWATGSELEAHHALLVKQRVPLGRVATPEEFADLFAFLVSDRASYITGTAINFDGGAGMTV